MDCQFNKIAEFIKAAYKACMYFWLFTWLMKYFKCLKNFFLGERFKYVKSLKPEWPRNARFRRYIFVHAPTFSGCCLGKKKAYLWDTKSLLQRNFHMPCHPVLKNHWHQPPSKLNSYFPHVGGDAIEKKIFFIMVYKLLSFNYSIPRTHKSKSIL